MDCWFIFYSIAQGMAILPYLDLDPGRAQPA